MSGSAGAFTDLVNTFTGLDWKADPTFSIQVLTHTLMQLSHTMGCNPLCPVSCSNVKLY